MPSACITTQRLAQWSLWAFRQRLRGLPPSRLSRSLKLTGMRRTELTRAFFRTSRYGRTGQLFPLPSEYSPRAQRRSTRRRCRAVCRTC